MPQNNALTGMLTTFQRALRRSKWNEYNKPGVQHQEAEWLNDNYTPAQTTDSGMVPHTEITNDPHMNQALFNESIKKMREIGLSDPAFLEAVELGRALWNCKLNAFDLFQIWCGFNEYTREQAPKHHDHKMLWDLDSIEREEREQKDDE